MATNWTNEQKLAGQANTTYNNPAITYSQATENYVGQVTTTWINESKN